MFYSIHAAKIGTTIIFIVVASTS